VLIHLINLLRHRRVDWAAMEFLLASQKKNRTWVILKQLLLLLLRMAAVAALVLAVAQPHLQSELGNLFGSSKTHHIVLLDDSFSMSDRWGDTSAMDEAKKVIERIGDEAARQAQRQTFTVLRFSRVGGLGRGTQPEMLEQPVDLDFAEKLQDVVKSLKVSETAAGPIEAIKAIDQLLGESDGGSDREHRIVYLISDFRARQWNNPADLRRQLQHLNKRKAKIHLINCVDRMRSNLAITTLAPAPGTRAAGVPLFMEVTVRNFGKTTAKDVSVVLEEDGHARPAVKIAKIPPGESIQERFLVRFPAAGQHRITARLESDPVATDNFRYCVVDFPVDVPVLIVDGDASALDARFLSVALAPGGPTRTGINARIETPRYLNVNPLDPFQTIYLANVDRLDRSAIESLEEYVSSGGGLGIFMGERCRSNFINEELYRDGEGLFPVPVTGPTELLVDRLEKSPDLEVTDHPIFQIFAGERNSFVSTVLIDTYFGVPKAWKPAPGSTTRVIARLRNGAPLAVEHAFGKGRVVVFLSTAAPVWNNWGRNNPSFVVAMQEMQAYLARRPLRQATRQVGSPLELSLDPGKYESRVRFVTPEGAAAASTVDAVPEPDGSLAVSLLQTDRSGVYETQLTRKDGATEVRRRAFNVDSDEGDLKAMTGEQLAARLEDIEYEYKQAADFQVTAEELAGYNLSDALLYLLILMLLGEQLLAYSASYHPPAWAKAPAKGGAR
jgi:Mg-chelatase subunit ChlD